MKEGSLRVPITRCHPNPWNPNILEPPLYKKLVTGLRRTLEQAGRIPPIVVRPIKEPRGYQIIDGFHRWKALQELGEKKINVYSIRVDDKAARILTNTLNYLRGSADRSKYAKGIVELIELGATPNDLAEVLPQGLDELDELLDETDISITALEVLNRSEDEEGEEGEDAEEGKETADDIWVDLKFRVSVPQAQVIEHELARLSEALKGKNARARALEYMAANSSGQPLPDDSK